MQEIFISWPDYDADGEKLGRRLTQAGWLLRLEPKTGHRYPQETLRLAAGCSAAIVSTDPFPAEVIAALDDLRVIARVGVGTDSIDIEAATRAGVAVTVTPGMNGDAVADHTLSMMLALCRRTVAGHLDVSTGGWSRVGPAMPGQLSGRVVGLVGGGDIAARVARRLAGFGARVRYFDPQVPSLDGAERVADLDELLAGCETVSLHIPLTPATTGLFSARRLAQMRPGAHLVNTARGGIVDEAALFDALRDGRLGGAALDVFAKEPPAPSHIAGVPNLVCSAHVAGLSHASVAAMTESATDSVLRVLAGDIPETAINASALSAARTTA